MVKALQLSGFYGQSEQASSEQRPGGLILQNTSRNKDAGGASDFDYDDVAYLFGAAQHPIFKSSGPEASVH